MIYVVVFDEQMPKKGIKRFLFRHFGKRTQFELCSVAGTPYCEVTVRTALGVPWELLEQQIALGSVTVLPRGVRLPEGCRLRGINGEGLRRKILLNGAMYAVEKSAQSGQSVGVALLDREGKYSNIVPRLLESAKTVTVVTKQVKSYTELADRLFDSIGAAPMVTDSAGAISDCEAVIAPDGLSGFGAIELPKVMFDLSGADGLTVTENCINAPFSQKLLESHDVFELLTAFSGERLFGEVDRLVPHSFKNGKKLIPIAQVCSLFCT